MRGIGWAAGAALAALAVGCANGGGTAGGGTAASAGGGAAPDAAAGWVSLFDGKDLDGWELRNPGGFQSWSVDPDGVLHNNPHTAPAGKHGSDLVTTRKDLLDQELHIEFKVPKGSNSGVYLRGRWEIQVLDSAGAAPEKHICGALYDRIAPRVNAAKPAGEWQSFDAAFTGRKLKVEHNGVEIINTDDVGPNVTGGSIAPQDGPGPLMLQGDHGEVWFRNIRVRPIH